MARSIQTDVAQAHALSGWIVLQDPPDYPGKFIARLTTRRYTRYLLVADSLADVHRQLPSGLIRSGRQLSDIPEMVEVWFTP